MREGSSGASTREKRQLRGTFRSDRKQTHRFHRGGALLLVHLRVLPPSRPERTEESFLLLLEVRVEIPPVVERSGREFARLGVDSGAGRRLVRSHALRDDCHRLVTRNEIGVTRVDVGRFHPAIWVFTSLVRSERNREERGIADDSRHEVLDEFVGRDHRLAVKVLNRRVELVFQSRIPFESRLRGSLT